MKILLTGASGYVGARIYFDLKSSFDLIGTFFSNQISKDLIQLDITNKNKVDEIVSKVKPEIIIHVANNPSSQWCKDHPEKAVELNQTSSEYLIDSANRNNAKIIYVSTMGAINPKDLYQKTKAASEKMFKLTKAGYLILRPSVGIGYSPNTTHDNFFNQILKCLSHDKKAVFDTSLKLQPTHLSHMSIIIQACLSKEIWNQVIPISVAEMKSRYEIANDILGEFGIKVTPVDNHIPPFNSVDTIDDELKKLGITTLSYQQAIKMTTRDIKNKNNIVI